MNNFDKLKKWLQLSNDNLRMNKDGFRGIYSTKDIKKNDIIMKIPKKYIIQFSDINKGDNHIISEKLYNTNSLVASYLLEKSLDKESHWSPYLETLPEKLDEYIYYYDKAKLDSLKNTSIMCKGSYNFTPFLISNAHFGGQKNKKKCKINSRNFTYDSLTFSSSVFILEEVKDEI